jgi:SAM-dependent methyltransferase
VRFVDVGAGPGTFTAAVPGSGLAIDQSLRALTALRGLVPGVPVVRADAFRLPLADRSMARFFTSHLYGLLLPEERRAFLDEAGRVAGEIVILDAGRPPGVAAEEWQERALPSGERYRVYRRHFDARSLAAEVEGDVLFAGRFYVLVARRPVRGRRA